VEYWLGLGVVYTKRHLVDEEYPKGFAGCCFFFFFLRRERNGISGMSRVLRWMVKWRHLGGVEN
jgi:hypothetical protein